MKHLIDAALDDFNNDHHDGMVDKNKVSYYDCSCSFYVCEVASSWVYCIKGVSCDIEYQIVKREAFHSRLFYRLRFEFVVFVDLPIEGDTPGSGVDYGGYKRPGVFFFPL